MIKLKNPTANKVSTAIIQQLRKDFTSKPVMQAIAKWSQRNVKKNITLGGRPIPFKAWSPMYALYRASLSGVPMRIGILTGTMFNSIDYLHQGNYIEVFTEVPYECVKYTCSLFFNVLHKFYTCFTQFKTEQVHCICKTIVVHC